MVQITSLGVLSSRTSSTVAFVVGLVVVLIVLQALYFLVLCQWADKETRGLGYYGRSLGDRRRFKRTLSQLALPVKPLLWLLSWLSNVDLVRASFHYRGVAGPKDSCTEESFRRASAYVPTEQDVFVATQMRCGTTWMQHLVFQVLTRGQGDLVESGRSLYAVSPWIEGIRSVSMDEAPLFGGERPRRIVKTHLPARICPFNAAARYIYVARHPVSCFASIVDFIRMNLGPFDVSLESFEKWYCSSDMWWGTWPEHIRDWWQLSQEKPNILFVRFEDMKRNLTDVVCEIATFLEISELSADELDQILHNCSYSFMKDNAEAFEMSVPTVLQCSLSPFVSGEIGRHASIPPATGARLFSWCQDLLDGAGISLAELYPNDCSNSNPTRPT